MISRFEKRNANRALRKNDFAKKTREEKKAGAMAILEKRFKAPLIFIFPGRNSAKK